MRNYGFDDIEYNPKMLNSLKIEQIDIKKKLHESRDSWDSEKYQKQQEELETKKLQIQETELKIDGLSKDIQLHDWLIKDPLSNKGLKAYIFNNMLDGVNNEAQKYSKRLGYHINFRIDLDSGNKKFETTIYEDNEERSYNDLSGGQQQLVIICTVFAIHDVYAKARQINILLMDEIFESLDSANIEKVSELIELKAQDMSLHLMTHNPHFSINYNNSIRLIRDSQRRTKIVL
jgi:DNA repair exonuclease SbcCD ATPase subunit